MLMIDLSPQAESYIQQIAKCQNTTAEKIVTQLIESNLPKRVERSFNYDLEEIKHAIESGFKPMPKFNSDEEFLAWANA